MRGGWITIPRCLWQKKGNRNRGSAPLAATEQGSEKRQAQRCIYDAPLSVDK